MFFFSVDNSQSFLYAELFKYLWLLQADPKVASLDDYVFNTEGHPLLIEKGCDFTSATSASPEVVSKVTHIPTKTNKKVSLPFFSGIPGVHDITAPRALGVVVNKVENVLTSVASLLDNISKGKGEGKKKRASELGHGKMAKRKQAVFDF